MLKGYIEYARTLFWPAEKVPCLIHAGSQQQKFDCGTGPEGQRTADETLDRINGRVAGQTANGRCYTSTGADHWYGAITGPAADWQPCHGQLGDLQTGVAARGV